MKCGESRSLRYTRFLHPINLHRSPPLRPLSFPSHLPFDTQSSLPLAALLQVLVRSAAITSCPASRSPPPRRLLPCCCCFESRVLSRHSPSVIVCRISNDTRQQTGGFQRRRSTPRSILFVASSSIVRAAASLFPSFSRSTSRAQPTSSLLHASGPQQPCFRNVLLGLPRALPCRRRRR